MPLRPNLPRQLDAAYARNVEHGLVLPATAGGLGAAALADAAVFDASAAGQERQRSLGSIDAITNPELRTSFEASRDTAVDVYAHIGLTVPEWYELSTATSESGNYFDFARLQAGYEQMQHDPEHGNLAPQLIIAPLNMSKQQTRALLSAMTHDPKLPNPRLQEYETDAAYSDGLYINDQITDDKWEERATPHPDQPVYTDGHGIQWAVCLLPGTPKPRHLTITHAEATKKDQDPTDSFHLPTHIQLLGQHLQNLQTGAEMVDGKVGTTYYWSWARGAVQTKDGARAPIVCWTPGLRAGVRLPVRPWQLGRLPGGALLGVVGSGFGTCNFAYYFLFFPSLYFSLGHCPVYWGWNGE